MPTHAQLTPRQVRDLLSPPEGDLDPQINEDITYLELRPLLHHRQGFRERDEVHAGRDQWSPASSRMWAFLHGHYVAPNHRLLTALAAAPSASRLASRHAPRWVVRGQTAPARVGS